MWRSVTIILVLSLSSIYAYSESKYENYLVGFYMSQGYKSKQYESLVSECTDIIESDKQQYKICLSLVNNLKQDICEVKMLYDSFSDEQKAVVQLAFEYNQSFPELTSQEAFHHIFEMYLKNNTVGQRFIHHIEKVSRIIESKCKHDEYYKNTMPNLDKFQFYEILPQE